MNFEDQIFKELGEIRTDIKKLIADVAGLKIKSGIWGLIGGMIPVVIGVVYIWMKSAN